MRPPHSSIFVKAQADLPVGKALGIGLIVLATLVSPSLALRSSWKVPPEADLLVNPVPGTQESLGAGSVIYAQRCAVCHGDTGQGGRNKGGKYDESDSQRLPHREISLCFHETG